jgi:hypothetical protein
MPVVVEGVTVVIPNASLERLFPAGAGGFEHQAPNNTYRSDGTLTALSFMVFADAKTFVGELTKYGFSDPWSATPSEDVAVVVESIGFDAPCTWLHVDLKSFIDKNGHPSGATIVWTDGQEPSTFAVPRGWSPQRMELIPAERLAQSDVVNVDRDEASGAAVVTYRERETGRAFSVARTGPPGYRDLNQRYRTLREDLARLMKTPHAPKRTTAAAKLYETATEIVNDAQPDPSPLLTQGVAARLAGRVSDAEAIFRRVAELWPDNLGAWLELTVTFMSVGRLDEAETAARHAVALDNRSAAAQGNLAGVLYQGSRFAEALPVIDRAFELDPSDSKNQRIRALVRLALERSSADPPPDPPPETPWYRRWFRQP